MVEYFMSKVRNLLNLTSQLIEKCPFSALKHLNVTLVLINKTCHLLFDNDLSASYSYNGI